MTNNTTRRTAGVLMSAVAAALVGLGMGAAPAANAADECGLGYHLVGASCMAQPWLAEDMATVPAPGAPLGLQCWTDPLGEQHCHPGI